MNFVNEYIKYFIKSKGRHGIHSPFVYELLDKCLKIKISDDFISKLNHLQKSLSCNKTLIQIEDAGAGSKKLTNERTIQSIYKTASCKGVYAKLLYQLSYQYKPKNILELGTSLGIGTIHLAAGNREAKVTTIDACRNTLEIAEQNFSRLNLNNIEIVNAKFEDYLKHTSQTIYDLVYIDGHHEGKALKMYLKLLSNFTDENTIFLLDDIRWSEDMFESWNEIISLEEFHLTMDLFRMGIIIRRPQQVKEHFVIKLKNILSGF
jgi:predicted O-methyltransferase YrrM